MHNLGLDPFVIGILKKQKKILKNKGHYWDNWQHLNGARVLDGNKISIMNQMIIY